MRRRKRLLTTLVILFAVASIAIQLTSPALALSREEQLQQKIQQIVSGIPGSVVTQTQKALYLHDYVVRNVSYEMVGDHQTAYGALLDGKAVCAGYADAYLRLLHAVGIEAVTLTGTADNGSGIPQSHAWTLVMLDGKCLYTDVTWDDPFINGVQDPNHISYDYFNLTREEISLDHFPDASSQQLMPAVCGHTGYDYYSTMRPTAPAAASLMTRQPLQRLRNTLCTLEKLMARMLSIAISVLTATMAANGSATTGLRSAASLA